jgi:tRNA A-37 threonylcarbamoyl transferase component Bud32
VKRRCAICHASYTQGESFCPRDGGAVVGDDITVDELVGKTLDGRYLITRVLGRGGMGKVYEADHIGLGKRVAVKLISDADVDRDVRARFRQEARAASKIAHEHVVQIFDVGVDGDRDYLVMEYVDGRDLDTALGDGPMSAARAIAIARQILHGLHACHAAGVIHRDIKPSNIRLTNSADFVKIMDFGIAKSVRAEVAQTNTGTGRVIGTPQFMAPEQILDGAIDARTDIYAVGATLYAMLAGKPPFASTSFTQRVDAMSAPPPAIDEVRSGLPASLVQAITRAMQRDPAARFPDALAFADALGDGAAVAGARMEAATKPMSYPGAGRAPDMRVDRRRWFPIAGVLLAIVAAGVAYALTRAGTDAVAVVPDAGPVIDAAELAPDAQVVDAPDVVDAVVAVGDASPVRRRVDAQRPAGTVITRVETGPACACRVRTADDSLSFACVRKRSAPSCVCEDENRNGLCPFVLIVTNPSTRERLPDGSREGVTHCLDRTRSACDPLAKAMPDECRVYSHAGTDKAVCKGYVVGMVEGDVPKTGTERCTICDWAKTARKFYGKTGDACVGFEYRTGEKLTGVLDC